VLQSLKSREFLAERENDYRIGSGDVLEISIYELERRDEFKTVEVRVEESGEISLPIVGTFIVGDLTVAEVEHKLNKLLVDGQFIKDPRLNVVVKEFRSKSVAALGAIEKPGEYTIRQNVTTLLDVLSMAGGPTPEAGYEMFVIKGLEKKGGLPVSGAMLLADPERLMDKRSTIAVDLISLLEEGNLVLNAVLGHGDVIYLPKAKMFYVIGFVRKPGGFPLIRPITVLEGIALAEGLMENEASPTRCALKRITDGKEELIPLDLLAIAKGKTPNFYLQADDIIDVRQTTWKWVGLEALAFFKRIFHFGYELNPRRID